jgi:hypothetical protein
MQINGEKDILSTLFSRCNIGNITGFAGETGEFGIRVRMRDANALKI